MYFKTFLSFILVIITLLCKSQTANINLPGLDEAFRRNQLLEKYGQNVAATIRPYDYSLYDSVFIRSSSSIDHYFESNLGKTFLGKRGKLSFLPVITNQQYNSLNPFGFNDGSMIAARGYQLQVSAGFYMKYGPLRIQLNPEMVWAQNQGFTTLGSNIIDATARNTYNNFYSYIDNPERVVNGTYQHIFSGQSSITLNYKTIAIGISSENLWWGPGIVNSLIMSNNAPGFTHLSFNSIKPIKTVIGSFEYQLISGITKSSPNAVTTNNAEDGYVNGLTISYNPKWIPGLFVGAVRVYNQYLDDAKTRHNYLPVFLNLFRANDSDPLIWLYTKQNASLYFRYVFKKAHAEVYAEYGRNDAAFNLRDLLMDLSHTRAFIVGGQKIFEIQPQKEYIQVQSEITQLESPNPGVNIRPQSPSWYVHSHVTRGYTNMGKVMGAGIGPGSNCRNISIKWLRSNSSIGINFMQIDRNNDLYYELFTNPAINRKWVDNVIGLNGNFLYGKHQKMMINWNIDYIHTKNYHWLLDKYSPDDPTNATEYRDNWHIKISTIYKL